MSLPTCSLSILVARTDLPFMMHTIPHLVKMSNFPFKERIITIDTAPLSGEKAYRPGVGTLEELRECCQQLLRQGIVDQVVDVNYTSNYQNWIYQKHFGYRLKETHGGVGCPILPHIFGIEEAQSDYVLHYDSDMLLYQSQDFNWIEESIKLMEKHPEIVTFRPLPGPPARDNSLHQALPDEIHPYGFYAVKSFSARAYLINRQRFEEMLPLPLVWRSYRNRVINKFPENWKTRLNFLTGKGSLIPWETMVSLQIENTHFYRGILAHPRGWTLHPKDRSPEFLATLPNIIQRIEKGQYPSGQGGYYDLILDLWLKSDLLAKI